MIEYWSKVHLLGLKSSPAVANTGVRFAVRDQPPSNGSAWITEDDLLDPLHLNATRSQDPIEKTLAEGFYVDDLLTSQPTEEDALRLIKTAISRLKRYDLNLCKVITNSQLVRQSYPPKDPLPEVISYQQLNPTDPTEDSTSLGLQWHIKQDTFSIKMEHKNCPKTRRGFLSYTMAVYDPQGIAAPLMLTCKLLQRELFPPKDADPHCIHHLGWDDPIPIMFHDKWDTMIDTCKETKDLSIPRPFYPRGHGIPMQQQLHAFADASDLAWCYVIYLRTVTTDKQVHVAFVCGNNTILPKGVCVKGQLSIPRCELNATHVLAKKVLEVEQALDLPKDICLLTIY